MRCGSSLGYKRLTPTELHSQSVRGQVDSGLPDGSFDGLSAHCADQIVHAQWPAASCDDHLQPMRSKRLRLTPLEPQASC